jgi:hypothetical protein
MSLLKFVALEVGTPLAHIFNLSLNSGIFPELLKKSKIVPLHKQGAKDNCDNYRPIALLSTISKILEKFVATRLVNHMELNKLMSPNQFGFLRNKNTEQCLVLATNFISNALNNGEYCLGIFLDLKKAFDVCSHSILLKKLKHYGVREIALKWFESYLSGRSQQVDVGGSLSLPLNIDISVLQGSILGPLLFLIYINDLPNSSNLMTLLFADDTQGLDSDKDLRALINRANIELKKWAAWFRANKMVVNTKKN